MRAWEAVILLTLSAQFGWRIVNSCFGDSSFDRGWLPVARAMRENATPRLGG